MYLNYAASSSSAKRSLSTIDFGLPLLCHFQAWNLLYSPFQLHRQLKCKITECAADFTHLCGRSPSPGKRGGVARRQLINCAWQPVRPLLRKFGFYSKNLIDLCVKNKWIYSTTAHGDLSSGFSFWLRELEQARSRLRELAAAHSSFAATTTLYRNTCRWDIVSALPFSFFCGNFTLSKAKFTSIWPITLLTFLFRQRHRGGPSSQEDWQCALWNRWQHAAILQSWQEGMPTSISPKSDACM